MGVVFMNCWQVHSILLFSFYFSIFEMLRRKIKHVSFLFVCCHMIYILFYSHQSSHGLFDNQWNHNFHFFYRILFIIFQSISYWTGKGRYPVYRELVQDHTWIKGQNWSIAHRWRMVNRTSNHHTNSTNGFLFWSSSLLCNYWSKLMEFFLHSILQLRALLEGALR